MFHCILNRNWPRKLIRITGGEKRSEMLVSEFVISDEIDASIQGAIAFNLAYSLSAGIQVQNWFLAFDVGIT